MTTGQSTGAEAATHDSTAKTTPDKTTKPATSAAHERNATESAAPEESEAEKKTRLKARIARDHTARSQAADHRPDDLIDYEMPEVEIVCKGLRKEIVGLTVDHVEATSLTCLRSYFFRKYFTSRLVGARIKNVSRIGLYITIELNTDSILVMSLGASGSPRRLSADSEPAENTEVLISFDQDGLLCFTDPVGTGQLFLIPQDGIETHLPETAHYGHDPLKQIAWTTMGQRLLQRGEELKSLLTDDAFMVGISDVYADEILFEAGLRYDRVARTLTSQEIRRLHRSLVKTLFDAIKYGGTSVPQRPFVDPSGRVGMYGSHLKVWGRVGQLSDRSRLPIQRVRHGASWTYYCDTQV